MKRFYPLTVAFLVVSTVSCSSPKIPDTTAGQAVVSSSKNRNLMANVIIQEVDGGLKINSQVSGLAPTVVHAIHIHETGECKGDFSSAGGHLNPGNHPHGGPAAQAKHAGDLGNLVSNEKGEARSEVVVRGIKFKDVLGKSIIIHAKADDLISQPSGNAGDRIACGVITRTTR